MSGSAGQIEERVVREGSEGGSKGSRGLRGALGSCIASWNRTQVTESRVKLNPQDKNCRIREKISSGSQSK